MLPSPAGIVIGYLVALFAVVAGTVAFPFSSIWMTLLFVVVGAFFVVAVPVIVMTYVFMTIAFSRAFIGSLSSPDSGLTSRTLTPGMVKPRHRQKNMEPEEQISGSGIDGSTECGEKG